MALQSLHHPQFLSSCSPPSSSPRRYGVSKIIHMSAATAPSSPSPSPSTSSPPTLSPPARILPTPPVYPGAKPPSPPPLRDFQRDVHAFWDYQYLFASQRSEVFNPIELELVEGALPEDLDGSYFLCGPGVFSDDHGSSVHPLDGHGYLRRFHIHGGSVEYSARYIDTEARLEEYDHEADSWNFKYRGPFSMLRAGERIGNVKVMKNTANTSVIKWAGRLMCLWEGGEPYEVDPKSLDTMGLLSITNREKSANVVNDQENWKMPDPKPNHMLKVTWPLWTTDSIMQTVKSNLVGLSSKILWPILKGVFSMPRERMLAHVRIDVKRQRLVAITCYAEDMVLPTSTFTVYEFDSSLKLQQKKQFVMHEQQMVHDWGLTENYYVLIANRIKLDHIGSIGAFAGLTPMISALSLDDSLPYAPMYLLPRFSNEGGKQRDWRIPVKLPEPLWLLHVANAYEEQTEQGETHVVMHASACTYDWFSLKHIFGYDWQKRRLDPSLMNDTENSFTETGELGAPHLVKVSAVFKPDEDENYVANVHRPQGWQKGCDFPSVNLKVSGLKNTYTYLGGSSGYRSSFQNFPFDTVVKIRNSDEKADKWWVGDRSFIGEPLFVPRYGTVQEADEPGFCEDDGYILCIQYAVAEQLCYLLILDAQKLDQKDALVAKLRVPKSLSFPIGFHGFWEESQVLSHKSQTITPQEALSHMQSF